MNSTFNSNNNNNNNNSSSNSNTSDKIAKEEGVKELSKSGDAV